MMWWSKVDFKGTLIIPKERVKIKTIKLENGGLKIMMDKKWETLKKLYAKYKELFGVPDVKLVDKNKWKQMTGETLGDNVGMSSDYLKLITVDPEDLKKSEIEEVTVHELLHVVFPNKPHWWIECASSKIARTKDAFLHYAVIYGHTKDELPSRNELIEMVQAKAMKI